MTKKIKNAFTTICLIGALIICGWVVYNWFNGSYQYNYGCTNCSGHYKITKDYFRNGNEYVDIECDTCHNVIIHILKQVL